MLIVIFFVISCSFSIVLNENKILLFVVKSRMSKMYQIWYKKRYTNFPVSYS